MLLEVTFLLVAGEVFVFDFTDLFLSKASLIAAPPAISPAPIPIFLSKLFLLLGFDPLTLVTALLGLVATAVPGLVATAVPGFVATDFGLAGTKASPGLALSMFFCVGVLGVSVLHLF